jgi:protein SCO1/2
MLSGCHGAISALPSLPYYVSADFTPVWADAATARGLHRVAPFSFIDQNGRSVTEKTFAGKIYVANFMFTTCPGLCPLMSRNLETLQQAFRDDAGVLFLSHSVTPEMDSVPVLRAYATAHHAVDGKWFLVTGKRVDIYAMARQSYFADESVSIPGSGGDFLHSEKMFLVDGNGHLRGVYNGILPAEMEKLKEDILILKREG